MALRNSLRDARLCGACESSARNSSQERAVLWHTGGVSPNPNPNPNPNAGVFLTTISFGEDEIHFSPNQADVLSVLNANVVEGMLWCVTQTPRLLHIRNLAHYFDGKLTGLHPTSIIKATPRCVSWP